MSPPSPQAAVYEARIRDLEAQLVREQDEHITSLSARDSEIRRLHMQMEEQLVEYRDLLDIKIQLDNEIQSYRKLLEAEESRWVHTHRSHCPLMHILLSHSCFFRH